MQFQDAVARLRARSAVPLFVSGVWDPALGKALREASVEQLFGGQPVRDPHAAACAVAGLHLWNDDFNASHLLCQGIHTETGSYWHALCHRREGTQGEGLRANLSNARYWNRQTGRHPAQSAVYTSVLELLEAEKGVAWATDAAETLRSEGAWDAHLVVDWFAEAAAGSLPSAAVDLLQELQLRELTALTDWCERKALGRA